LFWLIEVAVQVWLDPLLWAWGEALYHSGKSMWQSKVMAARKQEQDLTYKDPPTVATSSPARPHILNFLAPPKIVPPAGDQAFKTWACGGHFYSNTTSKDSNVGSYSTALTSIIKALLGLLPHYRIERSCTF
jgi:hypothetical protein